MNQPAPAFILDPNPTVKWPVTVHVPADGGLFIEQRFTGTFRVLPEKDYLAMFPLRSEEELKKRTMEQALAEHAEVLPGVLVGWDVKDPAGRPIGIDQLPSVLRGPSGRFMAAGVVGAITEIRVGIPARNGADAQPGATLGNSSPAPAAGHETLQDSEDPTN